MSKREGKVKAKIAYKDVWRGTKKRSLNNQLTERAKGLLMT
jgi:hypothetical protein